MASTKTCFAEGPSRLRAREAVIVGENGLIEEFARAPQRRTAWSLVRGVRWLSHDEAEVLVAGGGTLALPKGIDDLPDLVAQIEGRAASAQVAWQADGIPAHVVRDWLGNPVGGRWRSYVGVLIALAATFGALLALAPWLPEEIRSGTDVAIMVAVQCVVYLIGMISIGMAVSEPSVAADTEAVTLRCKRVKVRVPWRHICHVATSPAKSPLRQHVTVQAQTPDGPLEVTFALWRRSRLLTALQSAVDTNNATFTSGDARPAPDTALSPARLTGDSGAERGLSQSDGRPGSANLQVRTTPEQCGPGGPRSQEE